MSAKKPLLGIYAGFILLAVCTLPKPAQGLFPNKNILVEQGNAQTAKVTSWELRGALAAKNKSKGWSASMHWMQQGPGNYHIRLMGPLGSGTVVIYKQGNTIIFQDGSKKITSTNAEQLLLKQTGVRLPVNNLYYWVRGLPAPGTVQSQLRDNYKYLRQLKQNGYIIDFTQYTSVNGLILPTAIRLVGKGIMIKVVIKNWRLYG